MHLLLLLCIALFYKKVRVILQWPCDPQVCSIYVETDQGQNADGADDESCNELGIKYNYWVARVLLIV
jgi:hypothetical protein